jgi:hypothetical protein
MDMNLVLALILAFVLFIAVLLAPGIYATWRRVMSEDSDLQLWPVLSRKGLTPHDAAGKERELVIAARKCLACNYVARCDAWLAAGRKDGLEAFCWNHAFFDDLKIAKRRSLQR